jgi:hypothetical protein
MCYHVTLDDGCACGVAHEQYFPRAVEAWKFADRYPNHAVVERCEHPVPDAPLENVKFEVIGTTYRN